MSLIQDALKRQAEETAGMRPAGQPVQPIAPPPQQQKPPEMKKNKALPIVPFILLLVVFLVALLGLSFYLIKPKLKAVPKTTQKPVPAEPVKVPAEPVQVIKATIPVETPVAIEPAVSVTPVQESTQPWPELKLTGIAQGDRQRLAILNGKTLTAGRRLGEVAIIEVQDSNILVEYHGERRTLYIGE